MGITFSSPELQGAVSVGGNTPPISTSYAFAPTDLNNFGVSATVSYPATGTTLYTTGQTLIPILTAPPNAGGAVLSYTCDPITDTDGNGIIATSIDCPGALNNAFAPGTATIEILKNDPDGGSTSANFAFSIAASTTATSTITDSITIFPTTTVTNSLTIIPTTTITNTITTFPTTTLTDAVTTHKTVTGLIPIITTVTIAKCPFKPITTSTPLLSSPIHTTLKTTAKVLKRDVGFAPPDSTYSNGQAPQATVDPVTVTTDATITGASVILTAPAVVTVTGNPVTVTAPGQTVAGAPVVVTTDVTKSGAPITVRPTVTVTLPDLNLFNYKTCTYWPY